MSKIQTPEQFLCNYLNSSREELQYNISKNPTKVIRGMDIYSDYVLSEKIKEMEKYRKEFAMAKAIQILKQQDR